MFIDSTLLCISSQRLCFCSSAIGKIVCNGSEQNKKVTGAIKVQDCNSAERKWKIPPQKKIKRFLFSLNRNVFLTKIPVQIKILQQVTQLQLTSILSRALCCSKVMYRQERNQTSDTQTRNRFKVNSSHCIKLLQCHNILYHQAEADHMIVFMFGTCMCDGGAES